MTGEPEERRIIRRTALPQLADPNLRTNLAKADPADPRDDRANVLGAHCWANHVFI